MPYKFTLDNMLTALSILVEEDSVGFQDDAEVNAAVETIQNAIESSDLPLNRVLYEDVTPGR